MKTAMLNNLEEARIKAAEMFVNFSCLLRKDVVDSDGNVVGRLWDISAKLGDIYPRTEEIVIFKGAFNRAYTSVECSHIRSIGDEITLDIKESDIKFTPDVKAYEFMLKRDILDQQVVDTFNHKVRRVNDVQLLKVDNEFFVAHVDIGLRGLIRRLGWEKVVDIAVRWINSKSKYLKSEELVSWKYVQPVTVNPASMTMKLSLSEKQLTSIPAADLGDIIFDLNPAQRMAIFRSLDLKTKAKVLENLDLEEQKSILKELDKKEAAVLLSNMSSDEATDLLENLPHSTVKNLLTLIESGRAKKLSTLLGYSSDSAGGLMTTEFASVRDTVTVAEAIEYIRNNTKELETVLYLFMVDEKNKLKGITTIRKLLFADPKDPVIKTAYPKILYVNLNHSAQEVAYIMDKYKISAIPVVDEHKILQGMITMDDILSQVISIAWRKRHKAARGV